MKFMTHKDHSNIVHHEPGVDPAPLANRLMRIALLAVALALMVSIPTASPARASSLATCTWLTPEYPHISLFNLRTAGTIDIKASTQGECSPSSDPVSVTATMTLERQSFLGIWSTVAIGVPITKSIQGSSPSWGRGELFAVAPCVPGTYRGRLTRVAQVDGGIAVLLGDDIVSPPQDIDCRLKRVSMVIDDTGSMGDEIGSVASALTTYISSRPEDEYTRWNLTTFKDSPTSVGTTEDRGQALSFVSALRASGGGDCPEDVLGGISTGLGALGGDPSTDKQMLVATDASAQAGDVDGIIASAVASGVRVNVLLTGDCGLPSGAALAASGPSAPFLSSQVVLKRIAQETGGKYFFIPGGTAADFTSALNDIFASFANPVLVDTDPPVVQLSLTPSSIWPPNHQMVEITPSVTATDNLDPHPTVELVGIEVSQPDDGQGDGHTPGDVQVTPAGRIFVRAERSATNGARVYTVTYRATDASGNTGFASATVFVPRSQGTP
jgi:hypothetical protein